MPSVRGLPLKRGRRVGWAACLSEVAPAPDESAVADKAERGRDSDAESDQTVQSASTIVGDSVHSEEETDAEVAATGPHSPRVQKETRPNACPPPNAAPDWTAARNEAEHVGNVGCFLGNWGKRPHNVQMRNHLDMALKRNPAMIIGLAECQRESEEVLRAPGWAGGEHAPKGNLECSDAFAYFTLRGNEESSVLIGIRQRTGNALELLLFWERRHEGTYKRPSGGGKADAYSR